MAKTRLFLKIIENCAYQLDTGATTNLLVVKELTVTNLAKVDLANLVLSTVLKAFYERNIFLAILPVKLTATIDQSASP